MRSISEARLPGVERFTVEDFLPDTEAIAAHRHSPYITWLIYGISGFVVAAVAWMVIATTEQVATAQGIVRPTGKAKFVAHPDGGRVARVFVKDGDAVREGQELLALDGDLIDQEIAKARAALQTLAGEVARLEAETADGAAATRPPEFPRDLAAPVVIADQLSLWRSRQGEIAARRAALGSVVDQARSRILNLQNRVRTLEESVAILAKREEALRGLVGQQYFPELQYLGVKRDLVVTKGDLTGAIEDLRNAHTALVEAMERRSIVDREWNSTNFKRLGDAKAELDRARAIHEQQLNLKRNLSLRAPVDGIVNGFRIANPGQTVRPGEQITGIIPAGEVRQIEIEARVTNNDIGMITLGQDAIVKFQTYDWVRYGYLKGKVSHIGADATTPDPSTGASAATPPYFSVIVQVPKDYLGDDPRRNRVTPGMTGSVDLLIGERSILAYFTDRMFQTVQGSMRER